MTIRLRVVHRESSYASEFPDLHGYAGDAYPETGEFLSGREVRGMAEKAV
jgi:hypothetical protein